MSEAEDNRRDVLDYFETVFNQHDPVGAAKRYLGPNYVHHGSGCGSGKQDFIQYFSQLFRVYPQFGVKVTHCVAENDLVVLLVEVKNEPAAELQMVAEFYRLERGKIVEHWHVVASG